MGGPENLNFIRGKRWTEADYGRKGAIPFDLSPDEAGLDPTGWMVRAIERVVPGAAKLTPEQWPPIQRTAMLDGRPLHAWGYRDVMNRFLSYEASMLVRMGGGYNSNYGWRIDPFTGQHSLHEGIDFAGGVGTPILAAAGGVVVYAEYHSAYGNMVEIDHGNELITRYAHASKLHVKVGEMVLRGAKIAEVGSTGRSTGTHLHFEVRQRGIAVNPAQFLQLPG